MLSQVIENGKIIESYAMPDHDDSHHLVVKGQRQEITGVAINTTLDETYYTVLVDAVGGNRTITLPPAASHTHRLYNIKKIDASANTVTIVSDNPPTEKIDGAINAVIGAQWNSLTLHCNGTGWFII